MPAEIYLTANPIRVTGLQKQTLSDVLEVSAYKELALLLRVLEVSGGSATVRIMTGMQKDSYDGWVVLGTYQSTSSITAERLVLASPLKYIAWEVSVMSASGLTFTVEGVGREC